MHNYPNPNDLDVSMMMLGAAIGLTLLSDSSLSAAATVMTTSGWMPT